MGTQSAKLIDTRQSQDQGRAVGEASLAAATALSNDRAPLIAIACLARRLTAGKPAHQLLGRTASHQKPRDYAGPPRFQQLACATNLGESVAECGTRDSHEFTL